MADIHDALIVKFRRLRIVKGLKEEKAPTPTFRPDFYATKRSKSGGLQREIMAEMEIENSVFKDHTADQLNLMDHYVRKRLRNGATGFLVVPRQAQAIRNAQWVLDSLFPEGTPLKLMPL